LLVITGELDAALTKALPRLLREVRDVVGERRVAVQTNEESHRYGKVRRSRGNPEPDRGPGLG
jgi:hypothetical protein